MLVKQPFTKDQKRNKKKKKKNRIKSYKKLATKINLKCSKAIRVILVKPIQTITFISNLYELTHLSRYRT